MAKSNVLFDMSEGSKLDYPCSYCDKSYVTRNGLWKHIKNHHKEDEKNVEAESVSKISCNICLEK